jgi:glutamate-1-semialdehyde 2,1-aminomutase
MTQNTVAARSSAIWQQASRSIPGGVFSNTRRSERPYAFVSAEGPYITDADDQRYVDFHSSFGAVLLGHNAEVVRLAVEKALREEPLLVGFGTTRLEVEFAELIVAAIPSAEQVITTTSGSEATYHAIRLARAVTGRRYLLKFQGCFHGWHDAVARNVISPPDRLWKDDPISEGSLKSTLDDTLIAEFNDLGSVRRLFAAHDNDIAAVILEPIPHNIGCVLPTDEFLRGLRELTSATSTVLIFDEVVTGFRHARGGYQEICGVLPDITTFGKSVGNGVPVAGLAGKAELLNEFDTAGGHVLYAGTFNGNSVSMAAAIATLTEIESSGEDFYNNLYSLGDRMRSGLSEIVRSRGLPCTVMGFGSVFCLYFLTGDVRGYADLLRNDALAYKQFHQRMTDKGFFMLPLALKRNHISAAFTETNVDDALAAAEDVLGEMVRDGTVKESERLRA